MATIKAQINSKYSNTGVEQAKQGLQSLGQVANTVQNLFKGFVALKALSVIKNVATDTMNAFSVQQKAISQLTLAIGNNANLTTGALKRIVDYTGKLQGKSIFGDETLQEQATLLSAMGLTEEQIKKTLNAAVELSSAGVGTLEGNVKNLAKTFNGMTGELGESIPALKGLTKEQLLNGEAVDLISEKYKGFAENLAGNTVEGKTKSIANIIGDIKEKFGAIFALGKVSFLDAIEPVLVRLNNWLSDNLPKIINFFIHLPEVAALAFQSIKDMMAIIFTVDFWVNYFSSVGGFIVQVFKSMLSIIWEMVKTIASTLWNPLQWAFESLVYTIQSLFIDAINSILKSVGWLIDKINLIPGIKIDTKFLNSGMEKPVAPVGRDDKIIESWKKLGSTFSTEVKSIGTSYATALKEVATPLEPVFDKFEGALSNILSKELPENIKQFLSGVSSSPLVEATTQTDSVGTTSESSNNGFSLFGGADMSPITLLINAISPLIEMFSSLASVKMILDPLMIIFKGIFDVLKPIIDSLLRPLIGIFRIIGETIGKVLAPLLMRLSPVIELISMAFVFLYNYAIRPLANAIIWVIATLTNMVAALVNGVISALNHIPFVNIKWRMATMSYDSMKLDKITTSDLDESGAEAGVGYSGSSSGSSASYSGARDIIINVNIDRSAIADLRDVSILIRNEIKSAEALGY